MWGFSSEVVQWRGSSKVVQAKESNRSRASEVEQIYYPW